MAKVLIKDGFTRAAKCPEAFGVPEVNYRYRPALFEQSEPYLSASRSENAAEIIKQALPLLEKQLQSWDVECLEDNGQTAKIEVAMIKLLPRPVIQHMLNSVCGYGAVEQEKDAKN